MVIWESEPCVVTFDGDGELDYAIPAAGPDWDGVLEEGAYMVIHIGGALDTDGEDLYAELGGPVFDNNGDSVALLDNGADGRDFLNYGDCADLPPGGTSWNGDNPESPVSGQSLGRDMNSLDSNFGDDWENTGGVDVDYPTPGGRNLGIDAEFTANKTTVFLGKGVNFTDLSSGGLLPYTYEWDFDNDTTVDSTQQNPSWTPAASGTYTVSLTVTDGMLNQDTETKVDYIVVNEEWTPTVYDTNPQNDKIEYGEMVNALMDYLTGTISYSQVIDVLMCYLTS